MGRYMDKERARVCVKSKGDGPLTRLVSVIGTRNSGTLPMVGLLERVRTNASGSGVEVQLVDASKVYGPEHLEVAAEMAARAFRTGANAADTILVEFVRFASGRRQISDALGILGISGRTERIAVCLFGPIDGQVPDTQGVLKGTGLVKDDTVWGSKEELARAFGLGEKALATRNHDGWCDLVLERIAFVGLGK